MLVERTIPSPAPLPPARLRALRSVLAVEAKAYGAHLLGAQPAGHEVHLLLGAAQGARLGDLLEGLAECLRQP